MKLFTRVRNWYHTARWHESSLRPFTDTLGGLDPVSVPLTGPADPIRTGVMAPPAREG